jgi:glycosyltransferase involved in cell wall biosynthesis
MENLMKKILFVLPSLAGGGAERIASTVITKLHQEGVILTLILFNKCGVYFDLIPKEIEIIDLRKRNAFSIFFLIFKLYKIIRRRNPDVVVSFTQYSNIVTSFAFLFSKNRSRLVISERTNSGGYLTHQKYSYIKYLLMKIAYSNADNIIVISKGIKKTLNKDFNIPMDKITVIYNPIDLDNIVAMSLEEPVGSNNVFEEAQIVIGVGRLTKQKNFSLLIRSFAIVKSKMPGIKLVILGQGELLAKLVLLVEELELDGCVHFPGFIKNPFSWVARSSVFVLSSDWEGFGNVITESMACRTPVVATDCPSGPAEIIQDDTLGIVVPMNNEQAMAAAIFKLLNDKTYVDMVTENAFNKLKRYELSATVNRYWAEITG